MAHELFRFHSNTSVVDWFPIDDRVMGGASESRLRHDDAGHAVFEGVVSFANNGGFASIRSRPRDFAATGVSNFLLEVRGDGKCYKLSVRTDDSLDGVTYQARFQPSADEWTMVRLPLAEFQPTYRGRSLPVATSLNPARIRQFGLVIADQQSGAFSLSLRSILAE
jgi:NADH dehydrogenase [ubiquinone] 1 alpha subcomplex assembly factor 1